MRLWLDGVVRIDVFSDVVCPWCFLAARRLTAVLDDLGNDPASGLRHPIEIRWRAFQLDPGAGRRSTDLRTALEAKYGPGSFDAMTRRFAELGPPVGIAYDFSVAQRVNTFDAHRLLAWAWDATGAVGQNRLADALFSAYFEHGEDLADHSVLARLAGSVGLDSETAADVLAGEGYTAEVRADLDEAAGLDIHAVPTMVIGGQFTLPGAQDPDTLRSVLVRVGRRMDVAD